jgi:hypothetical protein
LYLTLYLPHNLSALDPSQQPQPQQYQQQLLPQLQQQHMPSSSAAAAATTAPVTNPSTANQIPSDQIQHQQNHYET